MLIALAVLPLACVCGGSAFDPTDGGTGGGRTSGASGGGTGGGTAGTGGGLVGGGTTGAGGGTGGPTEVCDGIDNDGDGIIDNVDVGGDGVCDCLKIATLGFPGEWGSGDVFNDWLMNKSLSGAVSLGATVLTAEVLAPFQILIVQDVRVGNAGQSGKGQGIGRAFSPEEVEVLRAWVANGGGVATLTGYADGSEVINVNSLLAPFGLSYGNSGILFGGGGQTVAVTHWLPGHTLTDGISKVGVDNGYPVFGDAGTVIAWEPNPGQSDVGRAAEVGQGHVFVWGDEWITYNSEWTSHTDYQVARFWLNMLKYLTPSGFCQVAIPPSIG